MRRIAVGVLLTGAVLPLVPLLIWAFAGTWRYPAVVPQQTSTRGLRLIVEAGSGIPHALMTSTIIALSVAALACLIGFPAGRAVGLYEFRGKRIIQFLLLAPVVVPGLAVTLGLQVFFIRFELSNTVAGVILVQLIPTVPYAATILAAAFSRLDVDLERQARSLGAGPWKTTIFVTIPTLRPAIAVAALLAFLISWSEYVLTLLVGGGQVKTLPLLLFAAIGSSDTSAAAVLALVVIGPPLILVAASARLLTGSGTALIGLGRA